MICGVDLDETCPRNSGSPLICPTVNGNFVCGVTSAGADCGNPGIVGLYVSTISHRNWLADVISFSN